MPHHEGWGSKQATRRHAHPPRTAPPRMRTHACGGTEGGTREGLSHAHRAHRQPREQRAHMRIRSDLYTRVATPGVASPGGTGREDLKRSCAVECQSRRGCAGHSAGFYITPRDAGRRRGLAHDGTLGSSDTHRASTVLVSKRQQQPLALPMKL